MKRPPVTDGSGENGRIVMRPYKIVRAGVQIMVIEELKPSKHVEGRWLAVLEDGSILRLG